MKSGNTVFFVVCAAAALLSGCSSTGSRLWIPNAPGDTKEESSARAATPPPAPRRPAPAAAEAQIPPTQSPFRNPPASAPAAPAPAAAATTRAPAIASAPGAGGYTQATRYGDLLFVSGQIAMDPRTNQIAGEKVEDQTRQVLENIRTILEAHRLTMANVVSVTVYMKDLAQFRAMDEVYESYFRTALPSRSVVEVSRLPRGALVEISVVAGR